MALSGEKAKNGLKSGRVRQQQGALVRSWAGRSRRIRGLVLYVDRRYFPDLKTGLGDGEQICLRACLNPPPKSTGTNRM